MKKLLLSLLSLSAFAALPTGNYTLKKIECSDGKILKLGGTLMQYDVTLKIDETNIEMTAIAKNTKWAPFKLNCTQVNFGAYENTAEGKYIGELPIKSVKCNAKTWEGILNKQHFGVEEKGEFDYSLVNGELTLFNPATMTPYSCKDTNSYPIYFYTKN